MRSASTSSPSRHVAQPGRGGARSRPAARAAAPTRRATRRRRARAPAPSPRAASRPARAPGGRRRAPRPRRPGCACAASTTSRRARPRAPRRPRSARAGRRRRATLRDRARGHPERRRRAPRSGVRSVCHGSSGLVEPELARRSARAPSGAERRRACRPGPPSCAASRTRARAAPPAASSPPSSPRPSGRTWSARACWSSVRPAIGVARCSRASRAGGVRGGARGPRAAARARARATSIAAVSRMSWLVAPRWTSGPGAALAQRRDERHDRVAALPPPARRARAGRARAAARRSPPRPRSGSPRARASARLGVEHRPQPRRVGDRLARPARAPARRQTSSSSSPDVVLGQRRRRGLRAHDVLELRALQLRLERVAGRCRCSIWVIHHEKCCTRHTRRRQRSE